MGDGDRDRPKRFTEIIHESLGETLQHSWGAFMVVQTSRLHETVLAHGLTEFEAKAMRDKFRNRGAFFSLKGLDVQSQKTV